MVVNIFLPLYMKTAKSVMTQNTEVTFQLTSVPNASSICVRRPLSSKQHLHVGQQQLRGTAQGRDTQCAAPADAILYGFTSRKLPWCPSSPPAVSSQAYLSANQAVSVPWLPPGDGTATSTLNWFICSVMFCWAETEQEEMLQWNHCLHACLKG